MRFETVGTVRLPKVGFGTWRIGGASSADRGSDAKSLAALRSALELGYTHFDTAEMYAGGHCEELVGRAIKESRLDRTRLFITTKVSPEHLAPSAVVNACERSLVRLGVEYVDLYLIHWPSARMRLPEAFEALNALVSSGKVRNLGVSNFNVSQLTEARRCSETPILTNQVPYSLSDRSYALSGMVTYCQANDILFTAYSPYDAGSLRVGPSLSVVANSRDVTPHQIALAWLCCQPRVIAIPMSKNAAHQKANLDAADLVLSDAEVQALA